MTIAPPLAGYREAIGLDLPFRPTADPALADRLPHLTGIGLRLLTQDPAV